MKPYLYKFIRHIFKPIAAKPAPMNGLVNFLHLLAANFTYKIIKSLCDHPSPAATWGTLMKQRKKAILLIIACIVSGCARLDFYSNPQMTGDTVGLKTYYSKPYILVARDGTAKVTSVSVVYLPDLEHPIYAHARSGYGSANLTLAFSNGMITSFGQQTDTKIPETLTALGGLDTSLATAVKTRAEAKQLEKQSGDFGKYSEPLKNVAKNLRSTITGDAANILSENARGILRVKANELDGGAPKFDAGLAAAFAQPGATANADNLIKDLEGIVKAIDGVKLPPPDQLSGAGKNTAARLTTAQTELNKILDDLKPKQSEPPALTLYEVIMKDGMTTMQEVPFGGAVAK